MAKANRMIYTADMVRSFFPNSSSRETWEAFILEPWFQKNLTKEQYSDFLLQARKLANEMCWDDYMSTFNCAVVSYQGLADRFGLPAELKNVSTHKMMRRFMIGRVNTFQLIEKQERFKGSCIEPSCNDLHNVEMAHIFANLPPQPETAEWLKEIEVTYEYDNLHMVTWFSGQLSLGEGFYSRSCPNHSAKKTYERLKNPWSLLWIAAALGEEPAVVKGAANEMRDYVSWTAKCGVVRRAIPFSRIYDLALWMREREDKDDVNWDVPMNPVSKVPRQSQSME